VSGRTAMAFSDPRRPGNDTASVLRALAAANALFWPTVAPVARRELSAWEEAARRIETRHLRELALSKLRDEHFNAEVAATLATLTPRPHRAGAVRAIVALELLFDYLDGRTETKDAEPAAEKLFMPFTDAVRRLDSAPKPVVLPDDADLEYLQRLSATVREEMFALPSAEALASVALEAATRCAQAQAQLHAASRRGERRRLEAWASDAASGSGLPWREYVAGSASSVLAVHALIAVAGRPSITEEQARSIDRAYLAIGAVITILDSIVDRREDDARGEPGFVRLFDGPADLGTRLRELIGEAWSRAAAAPNAAHHTMTLVGAAAYYSTHPGAAHAEAREMMTIVREELSPTIWPAVAVMRCWRIAKATRASKPGSGPLRASGSSAREPGAHVE